MIYYDSHKWSTLLQYNGSVFPMATMLAIPSAVAAFILQYLVQREYIRMTMLEQFGDNNSVYSGFTFVLGFSLVFRTSESYHRFWTAATSCHEMGSEWSDCCSSLIAFVQVSKKPPEEVQRFTHRIVRLFCLLHAMAMEEIAHLQQGNFPLIDIEGLNQKDLRGLLDTECHGKRVQVVLCWIKMCIIEAWDSGLLSVPPPILTRVFQELGLGLVEYHKAQQVVIWPFPFPYTQMNLVLVYVYMVVTPLVIVTWDLEPWLAALGTFFSVLCMVGLDLIASELENPFGEDANDLPVKEIHSQMIRILMLYLRPKTWKVPRLMPHAVTNFKDLQADKAEHRQSLMQSQTAAAFRGKLKMMKSMSGMTSKTKPNGVCNSRMKGQLEWAKAASLAPDWSQERLKSWLNLSRFASGSIDAEEDDNANGVEEEPFFETWTGSHSPSLAKERSEDMGASGSQPARLRTASSSRLGYGEQAKLRGSGSRVGGDSFMESKSSEFTMGFEKQSSCIGGSSGSHSGGRPNDLTARLQTLFQEQANLFAQMHTSQMNALSLLLQPGEHQSTYGSEDYSPLPASTLSGVAAQGPQAPLVSAANVDSTGAVRIEELDRVRYPSPIVEESTPENSVALPSPLGTPVTEKVPSTLSPDHHGARKLTVSQV
mmetsp:Transcript_17731/g.41122  ORF Transcript_17731/g.41122 Transcript_17731/m.41122 type:complete len:653 (-) Transcript_17731:54-2012(-)